MLIRHTLLYLLASAVSAIVGLSSAIVFTRMLTPAEYGVYVVGVTLSAILSALLFTWVRLSVLRFQSEGEEIDLRKTAFLAYLLSVCASPLALFVTGLIAHVEAPRLVATGVFTIGLGLFELSQEILKARQQSRAFAFASMLRSVAAFALCFVSAWIGGGGLGQLLMAGAAYFVSAGAFSFIVWRGPRAPVDTPRMRQFAVFGVSVTISGLVFALHAAFDRLFVAHLLGDVAAGQYGASADLVRQIILIPATSVAAAAVPMAVRALATGGARAAGEHLASSAELLAAVLFPAAVGLAMTAQPFADLVLGAEFRAAATQLMPILAFAWVAQSFSQNYVHSSYYLAERPNLLIAQGLATTLANLLLLALLAPAQGLVGAAYALALSEGFGFLFGFALTRYAHPLPMALPGLARVAGSTAAMAAALALIAPFAPAEGALRFVVLVLAGVLAYAAAALALNVAKSRDMARSFAARRAPAMSVATP
jgi:O-antigen/teichoic acid export membrane protein